MPEEPDGGFTIDDSEILPPTKKEVEEEQKKSPTTKELLRRVTLKPSFNQLLDFERQPINFQVSFIREFAKGVRLHCMNWY